MSEWGRRRVYGPQYAAQRQSPRPHALIRGEMVRLAYPQGLAEEGVRAVFRT